MRRSAFRGRTVVVLTAAIVAASCAGPDVPTGDGSTVPSPSTTVAVPRPDLDERFDLPPEARASDGGGGPRPTAYWAVWNACAPDNRAAEAAANGGRDAGWVLVDDLLEDPGIQLGDHLLTTCEESVALLNGRTGRGQETSDPVFALAGQLLAAELNLGAGAETCPAAEEAVVGAHLVLASSGFDGVSSSPLDAEAGGALPQIIDLLTAYNAGDLCY